MAELHSSGMFTPGNAFWGIDFRLTCAAALQLGSGGIYCNIEQQEAKRLSCIAATYHYNSWIDAAELHRSGMCFSELRRSAISPTS
ncbi:MAG: hypothetical protein ACK5XN_09025 [Bacteroidota bacterium]